MMMPFFFLHDSIIKGRLICPGILKMADDIHFGLAVHVFLSFSALFLDEIRNFLVAIQKKLYRAKEVSDGILSFLEKNC